MCGVLTGLFHQDAVIEFGVFLQVVIGVVDVIGLFIIFTQGQAGPEINIPAVGLPGLFNRLSQVSIGQRQFIFFEISRANGKIVLGRLVIVAQGFFQSDFIIADSRV